MPRCQMDAAVENTGIYWKPVGNVLKRTFEVLSVHPAHRNAVSGEKTSTTIISIFLIFKQSRYSDLFTSSHAFFR
jgi:hypothetical protein